MRQVQVFLIITRILFIISLEICTYARNYFQNHFLIKTRSSVDVFCTLIFPLSLEY